MEPELKEIFTQVKNLLLAHQEMGLEPPRISRRALKFLDRGPVGRKEAAPRPDRIESLEALRDHVGDCTRCKLARTRTHLVFGEGSERARLVFVGEGPGREEDLVGKPFVGEAGRLLSRIIENGMGLTREEVYICNVVKCRPPGNRDPEREEIEACLPFLKAQLRIIRPEAICVLGRVAGQGLLGEDFRVGPARGEWHSFEGIPLMPTYHPAYLLRNASAKRQVWEDVKKIMALLGLEVKKNG